jgi:hypothetical protein
MKTKTARIRTLNAWSPDWALIVCYERQRPEKSRSSWRDEVWKASEAGTVMRPGSMFGLKFDNGISRLGFVSSQAGLGLIAPIRNT